MRQAFLATLGLAVPALAGCVDFNVECTPNVRDPAGPAGWLGKTTSGAPVSLLKADVRTGDHTLGQLLAESYFHAYDKLGVDASKLPKVGVENSGAIRSECRETLPAGRIKRGTLRQIVPFDNNVFVVPMTPTQLKKMLEHSVQGFQKAGNPANRSPPGLFLQLYGVQVEVDCNQQVEELNADGTLKTDGQRVRVVRLYQRANPANEECVFDFAGGTPANPCSPTADVWVAVNSFLYGGNDDYTVFKDVSARRDGDKLSAGLANFNVAATYAQDAYPDETKPFPGNPAVRYVFRNCVLR